MKTFAKYIRAKRVKAKVSQTEIAQALNLGSGQLISNWERGICFPPLRSFKIIASLYGIKVEDMLKEYLKGVERIAKKKIGI